MIITAFVNEVTEWSVCTESTLEYFFPGELRGVIGNDEQETPRSISKYLE